MLVIRLQRMGKKNQPFFRVVLAEKTAPIKGKYIEKIGFIDPRKKVKNLKSERIKHWIGKGAQCSDTAWNLLIKEGIVQGEKRKIKIKPKKKEEEGGVKSAKEKEISPASAPEGTTAEQKKESKKEKNIDDSQKEESKEKKESFSDSEEISGGTGSAPPEAGKKPKKESQENPEEVNASPVSEGVDLKAREEPKE